MKKTLQNLFFVILVLSIAWESKAQSYTDPSEIVGEWTIIDLQYGLSGGVDEYGNSMPPSDAGMARWMILQENSESELAYYQEMGYSIEIKDTETSYVLIERYNNPTFGQMECILYPIYSPNGTYFNTNSIVLSSSANVYPSLLPDGTLSLTKMYEVDGMMTTIVYERK